MPVQPARTQAVSHFGILKHDHVQLTLLSSRSQWLSVPDESLEDRRGRNHVSQLSLGGIEAAHRGSWQVDDGQVAGG